MKPMYELSALLDDLGWTPRQCAVRLDVTAQVVEEWLAGTRTIPRHHIEAMRRIASIHNPGKYDNRQDTSSRTTYGSYSRNVDNIYDNYSRTSPAPEPEPRPRTSPTPRPGSETQGDQPRAEPKAKTASKSQGHTPPPEASTSQSGSKKNHKSSGKGAHTSESARAHAFSQFDRDPAERIHELEEELFRMRQSYKELSTKYARMEQEFKAYRSRRDSTSSGHRSKKQDSGSFGPYEVLGVKPDASWQVIKNTYRALCLIHHPDRGGDIEEMQRITAAYNELRIVFGE